MNGLKQFRTRVKKKTKAVDKAIRKAEMNLRKLRSRKKKIVKKVISQNRKRNG